MGFGGIYFQRTVTDLQGTENQGCVLFKSVQETTGCVAQNNPEGIRELSKNSGKLGGC